MRFRRYALLVAVLLTSLLLLTVQTRGGGPARAGDLVALALTPVIMFASLFFATNLTLVFPTLLAISLLLAAFVTAVVVYDGESTWPEGVVLVGLYVVIASAFWWG